jgi:glucokinase
VAPTENDVVLAIDVGSTLVKTAVVGPGRCDVHRFETATSTEPWNIERLVRIAVDVHGAAVAAGMNPACLVVAVPGQVDEYHGVVQYSATLPWHDVAVADRISEAVPVEVIVRHAARVAASAEANLGSRSVVEGTLLFVSIGASIVAAGAQSGTVVADHVGAGDLGRMRVRSGPYAGKSLDEVASTTAIARRYADATGASQDSVDAAAVHGLLSTDPVARKIWDEAVEALADGLEWSTILFAPRALVVGGGLVNAGDDLMAPLIAGVTRRLDGRAVTDIRVASFRDDAGWVGAALAGWRKAGWSVESLRMVLDGHFEHREP